MSSNQALDGFVAALLHDIRKLDFSQNQFGSNHENLAQTDNPYLKTNGVDFLALVGQDVADIVQAHGGGRAGRHPGRHLGPGPAPIDRRPPARRDQPAETGPVHG